MRPPGGIPLYDHLQTCAKVNRMTRITRMFLRMVLGHREFRSLPRRVRRVIRRVRANRLTYLPECRLARLASICLKNEMQGVPGIIIEAGCALGGSAIVIASAKARHRDLRIYDMFGMIPPPSDGDGEDVHERYEIIRSGKSLGIGGDTYYGYQDRLFEKVVGSFTRFDIALERHNVALIKGLIQETLNVDGPVALAHIDVDWYEPVRTSLARIEPHVPVGGAIVLDDYLEWSGCKRAVDEYFRGVSKPYRFDTSSGALVVLRK